MRDGRDSAWVLTAKDECAVLTVPGLNMNAVQGGFLQDFSAPVRDRVLFIRSTFRRPAELWVRTFPDGKETLWSTSYEPENEVAKKLYVSFGFVPNGEMDGDEEVAVLDLTEWIG